MARHHVHPPARVGENSGLIGYLLGGGKALQVHLNDPQFLGHITYHTLRHWLMYIAYVHPKLNTGGSDSFGGELPTQYDNNHFPLWID